MVDISPTAGEPHGTTRLRNATTAIREALLRPVGSGRGASEVLIDVARISGAALGAHRTNLWVFDDAREHLVCRLLLVDGEERPSGLVRLHAGACRGYLEAVRDSGALMVDDALADARTAELGAYLNERGIGALLDIAIVSLGQMQGLVCHEHVGGPRVWREEEATFAENVGALIAVALEAERRVLAERAQAGTEARYRHLVENLPVTVYTFSATDGAFEYVSPHIERLGGWSPDAWIAAGGHRAWLQAIEPPHRGRALMRFRADLDRGIEEEIEYRVRLPDGSRRWIRDTVAVVRDGLGRPLAVQGMLADISAQKDAELARAASEQSLRDVLSDAELLALVLDPDGRVRLANPYYLRLTGATLHELTGADWFERLAEPERARARAVFAEGVAQGRIHARYESALATRTFGERRILWSNTLVRDADGAVSAVVMLGLDITERVERQSAELQRQKHESLARLAAAVAHDVNNLLTVIRGAAADLEGADLGRATEARAELAGAVAHAGALVRSLLDFGRREERPADAIHADRIIEEAWPMALGHAARPRRALTLGAPGVRVMIDTTELRQVLLNLVDNAVDATREVGTAVTVTTRVLRVEPDDARALGLPTAGELWVLEVADDGSGMPEAVRARAIEPYFTTKPSGRGTGLGLAICSGVAQRAGGALRIDSAPGEGTTVAVYLPILREADEPRPDAARPLTQEALAPPRATVLVVEDQPAVRTLVRRVLEREGHLVLEAPDLARASALLAARSDVTLLIADGHLPDGSGVAFARAVQRSGAVSRVIIIAGEPIHESWPGLESLLAKPFSTPQLVAAVRRSLGLID